MKNKKRMQNIELQQKKLSSELIIFDAVNGDNIDMNNVPGQIIADNFKKNTKHRKREIGCFLSHHGILKKIQSEGNKDGYTVIFEDDFNIVVDNIEEKIQSTLESMKERDFDILYIETISNNIGEVLHPLSSKTPTKKAVMNEKNAKNDVCKIDMDKDLYGTQSYIVKNANIPKILENIWIIDNPIDWKYANAIKSNKLTAYTFCTFLTKSTDFESTLF